MKTLTKLLLLLAVFTLTACLDDDSSSSSSDNPHYQGRYQELGDEKQYIRDRVTGLEWQRCPVTEVWDPVERACIGETPRMDWRTALNLQADAGFRLPTLLELNTLVFCSDQADQPWLERPSMQACQLERESFTQVSKFFPETLHENWFWTASPTQSPDRAYYINFASGATGHEPQTSTLNVRLVRGQMTPDTQPDGAPSTRQKLLDGRFLTTGNQGERLLDLETGYEWQRCPVGKEWQAQDGICTGDAEFFTFAEANAYAAAEEIPGGFAAPSLSQLQSLILCRSADDQISPTVNGSCPDDSEISYNYPAISPAFPETASDYWYWSSTSANAGNAFFVDLGLGKTAQTNQETLLRLRLVRSTE